jgi:hypothetical protein
MNHALEQSGATSFACKCCGGTTRRVWGYLHSESGERSAYFVQWTQGRVELHGAFFDFVIGRWGDGTSAADRALASLEFQRLDTGPSFMVIDASRRGNARDYTSIAASVLNRADVIGTPLAAQLYELVDAVWLQDGRIRELTLTVGSA